MKEISNGQLLKDEFIREGEGNRITEVVVFTGQVYLKRQAKVQALVGLNRFLIEVRAFTVDEDSAQARVFGEGEILSVQYKEVPVKDAPQEEARSLDEKKEELERQRKVLRSEKDVINKQKMFLDSLIAFAEVEIPKEIKTEFPKTESLKPMLEFLETSYRKLGEQDCELENRVEELEKEISLVEKKLKQLRRPKDPTRKAVEILFKSQKDQEIKMEISYVARNAFWQPVYKVDVPLDLSSATITMFSRIRQKTGENWKDVQLAVSNAIPIQGTALPDLQSWYLRLASPAPFAAGAIPVGAVAMAGAPESVGDAVLEEEVMEDFEVIGSVEPSPEAQFTRAVQKELPHAFEYQLPQRVYIDSEDGETLLPLFTEAMEGEFFHYAVPMADTLAYLVCCAATNSALLSGRLNVHFGGRFVGGSLLAEKKAGEDLLVNLGAERGLKLRREKVTDKLAETFFGMVDRASVARELEYRVVVENLKDETVRVRLLDSIPVSRTDRIQVKGVETFPNPKIKDYQKREGVMLWELEMEPKSVQEIRIKFFVKHPKDKPPQGL